MAGAVCPVADNREVRYKAGASAIDRMNLFEVILFLGVIAGGVCGAWLGHGSGLAVDILGTVLGMFGGLVGAILLCWLTAILGKSIDGRRRNSAGGDSQNG